MIDSHTHSKYSKHAKGSIESLVKSAIENNIKILTVTDHAPFPIDINNRLLYDELQYYFEDIEFVQSKYANDITILKGLEVDFIPEYSDYTKKLLSEMELDFIIGSVHAVLIENKRINIWNIENIHSEIFIKQYFLYLEKLIKSELFDSIGHPDAILRGGMDEDLYCDFFNPLINIMSTNNISYEINSSGLRKSTYDIQKNQKDQNIWNYPSKKIIKLLVQNNISFTIGSDAHTPKDVYLGIDDMLNVSKSLGVEKISFYKKRERYSINIDNCIKRIPQ